MKLGFVSLKHKLCSTNITAGFCLCLQHNGINHLKIKTKYRHEI